MTQATSRQATVGGLADSEDGGPADDATPEAASTRERILNVAIDLFTEKGFDGASLREIAERLDVTKAAIYYHFASKDDILMALHMRLHEFGKDALGKMTDEPVTLELWGELLGQLVGQMLAQRKLFLLHERNQAALEKLHRDDHDAEHDDIQDRFRRVLADPRVSLRDRVRMACSFGAAFAGLFMSGDAFEGTSNQELGELLRDAMRDILAG
ncbi:MAG: TetR/AcrR family transcriptional regulator [Acidimicrobiales bacterium]